MPEREERLSSITGFHRDIVASGSYTDMNEMSKDELELLSDALGGLTRKQINNVLFASTLVGVDWLYQERPDVADEYSLRIGAGLVLWQLCIRAAQGRMYVRASEREGVK